MGRIRVYAPRKTRIIRLEDAVKARIAAGDSSFWVSGESFLHGLEADSRSWTLPVLANESSQSRANSSKLVSMRILKAEEAIKSCCLVWHQWVNICKSNIIHIVKSEHHRHAIARKESNKSETVASPDDGWLVGDGLY